MTEPIARDAHHRRLERMYHGAPVNAYFRPRMTVGEGEATVRIDVRPDFFHAAGAVHGSVYFKLLDDATFFAAASRVEDVFVLSASFTITFTRPVRDGEMIATGRVTGAEGRRLMAEGTIVDAEGREVGRGSGVFVRSAMVLRAEMGYE